MTQFNSRGIEWDRSSFLHNLINLVLWNEKKLCLIVNESGNEPWAGDTINMNMRTGDPKHFFLLETIKVK
jgi:hypothetical protein